MDGFHREFPLRKDKVQYLATTLFCLIFQLFAPTLLIWLPRVWALIDLYDSTDTGNSPLSDVVNEIRTLIRGL